MRDEKDIENAMAEKGLNAPRLTPEAIDDRILAGSYHVFPGTTTTVCCLTLRNGFTVTGESACVSTENFDAEIGRDVAYQKARDKVWELEGYRLRQALYEASHNRVATSKGGTSSDRKVLKRDMVIPAGTVFDNCDNETHRYLSGNYMTTVGLTQDSAGHLVYGVDDDAALGDWFENADA